LVGGVSAAPAFAAPTAPGAAPYCDGSTSNLNLQNGEYTSLLARPNSTINSIESWNGCIKVIYTNNATGNSRVAFYDPDTLQRVDTLRSQG